MQNPRLATRYAKSVLDLAVQQNSLDAVLKDMQLLNAICSKSHDFTLMLRSPVISGDKKLSIISQVVGGQQISPLTTGFIKLLVSKGRELNLPDIAEAFIQQYNELKNIKVVKLTTATPMADSIRASIQERVASFMPTDTIDLKTMVDQELIGGFVLEVEDKLYDVSVRKSLSDIRSKIIDSSYVTKM